MVIERAAAQSVRKPWGSDDLRPWSPASDAGGPIGEIWFGRQDPDAPPPALLLKLLFTSARLSIQVHPDDEQARSMGLPNGKSEAWYILGSRPGSAVAVGLRHAITGPELRAAVEDGSIADLVAWHEVVPGDAIAVPAGTIHAIGAGLVIAEIQQRSDTTFRIFDYGRSRTLHVDAAVAAAEPAPAPLRSPAYALDEVRTVLVEDAHFVLERIELPPVTRWQIRAGGECWLLVLDGHARLGTLSASRGQAFFVGDADAVVEVGHAGLTALVAYDRAMPRPALLTRLDLPIASEAGLETFGKNGVGKPATTRPGEARP